MAREADAGEIAKDLWIGSCPRSPEDIMALRQLGVSGLVSLQTDEDLRTIGLSWDLLWKFLMQQGITPNRVPIVDFNERALRQGLEAAVTAVHSFHSAGKVTYVHCTAGINRAPTVAIAYLVVHGGLDVEEAWSRAQEVRPQVAPLRAPLMSWLEARNS